MNAASQSKPLRIAFSVIGGLSIVVGGLGALDVVDAKVVGLLTLGVAAVTYGLTHYVEGQVTPKDAVGARQLPNGTFVAGDAGPIPTGTPVELSPDTGPSPYSPDQLPGI